jgi:hypothetical protein
MTYSLIIFFFVMLLILILIHLQLMRKYLVLELDDLLLQLRHIVFLHHLLKINNH